MPHHVSLLFDVEDLCWPDSDDITLDLATRLTQHGVQGTFFVVGEKARLFAARGRTDIIAALQAHDLASHTTSHSIHPTVAEYLADADWEEGVLRAMDEEAVGLTTLERVFGRAPTAWGQAGGSWGPQIHTAMARLNTPVVVYPRTRIDTCSDLHWYAGSLVFPGDVLTFFDAALTDDAQFEGALQTMWMQLDERVMHGMTWSGVFVCHPTRLRAVEFWDALNFAQGRNTEPDQFQMPTLLGDEAYQTALKNFDRLVTALKQDTRLHITTVGELSQTFAAPAETVSLPQIDQAVAEIVREEDIPTRFYDFSPAELLDLMARVYTNTEFEIETLRRRWVGGPTTEPPSFDPTDDAVFWDDFIAACRMLIEHINQRGQLPSSLYLRGVEWSIGSFYRAAINTWSQFRQEKPPHYVEWKPSVLYPTIGHEIASLVQEDYERWPIHQPDLDLNKLLMHTCFQCWTLRPANKW